VGWYGKGAKQLKINKLQSAHALKKEQMNKQLKVIFIVLSGIFLGDMALAQDSTTLYNNALKLEKEGAEIYKSSADSAISLFKQAAELYKKAGNKKAAAVSLLNAAYVHEDIRKDNYKAMELARESVSLWKQTADAKRTADAYKYLARQHARMNDNLNAHKRSDTAIQYYTTLKDNKNIALVYLALSNMYETQKQNDSAAKYATVAAATRKKVKGTSDAEMFNFENSIFRVLVLSDRLEDAGTHYKKLNKKVKKGNISKADKLNFYYYAWIYNTKLNNTEEATAVKAIYDELKK
jgi:tetratricopeptide (TPR) repeat protein